MVWHVTQKVIVFQHGCLLCRMEFVIMYVLICKQNWQNFWKSLIWNGQKECLSVKKSRFQTTLNCEHCYKIVHWEITLKTKTHSVCWKSFLWKPFASKICAFRFSLNKMKYTVKFSVNVIYKDNFCSNQRYF